LVHSEPVRVSRAGATTSAAILVAQLQTQISGMQDADETQSILNLTQAQTEQQAALQSLQQIPRTSLSIILDDRLILRGSLDAIHDQHVDRPFPGTNLKPSCSRSAMKIFCLVG